VVVSQDPAGAGYSGALTDVADLENTSFGQLPSTPECILTIRGESLTGGRAPRLRVPHPLGELFE
jgi:hypothetical protein